jgi:putative membrane protein
MIGGEIMEMWVVDLMWLYGALFGGILLGSLTGLIPGFHVNNVALILLSLSPAMLAIGIPLSSVAAIIVSCGVVHTFLNYIPSALIGAPDGDTALSLLPGHRMLLAGNAPKGVGYSARGSQLGLLLSLPLIFCARILFGPELGFYDEMRGQLPWILLSISTLLLVTETTKLEWPKWLQLLSGGRLGGDSRVAGMIAATAFFLLAGFYGWAVFSLPARSPVGMPNASLLLPSLAGLFGIANLIDIYMTTSELPPQKQEWDLPEAKPLMIPCFLSSVAGAWMAILPGMTAAQATVLVMGGRNVVAKVRGEEGWDMDFDNKMLPVISHEEILERARREAAGEIIDDPHSEQDLEIIAILSAVNTAVTVMVLGFLYIVGRSRSGATLALKMMYPIDTWSGISPTSDFIRLIAVTIAAGLIAVPMMVIVGKGVLKLHEIIPLQMMVFSVIIFITILVYLSTGWVGMGVLIVGTVMGLMPPRIGIRRSHGMGIILVPIMMYTFAQKLDAFGFL